MYSNAVCAILNWNWGKYTWFQYQTGLKYLELYSAPEGVKKILEANRDFWGWWKLNWKVRDEAFTEQGMGIISREQAEWIYRTLHDPQAIVQDTYPNQWIITPCIKAYKELLKANAHVTVGS